MKNCYRRKTTLVGFPTFFEMCWISLLLFCVLKVLQEGRIWTMCITHSPAQRSSKLIAYAKSAPEMARWSNTHCPNAVCRLELFNTLNSNIKVKDNAIWISELKKPDRVL